MRIRLAFVAVALHCVTITLGHVQKILGNSETLPRTLPKLFTPTNYSTVPNFFIQSSPDFNSTDYDLLGDSFGLRHKGEDRWVKFRSEIEKLNQQADEHTTYKVFYLARHGQGYHNVAETKYGTSEWNSYWSMLHTDGNLTWGPDAKLTHHGHQQAKKVNQAWKQQMKAGIPLPESLYSSPLSRSASTLYITWKDILIDNGMRKPIFKEMFRETIGIHTCDERSSKSHLEKHYPPFSFETPFSEHDELWGPIYQESWSQQALRTQQLLNQIFATDSSTYVSVTAHGGTIASFSRVVNHPLISIAPGRFLPIVVKAVNHRDAFNTLFAGGQSATAPPRSTPTRPSQRNQTRNMTSTLL